jgi:hypothetical protein
MAVVGRMNGLWSEGANARVSAVLVARHLVPWSVATTVPLLFRNPAASYLFEAELAFAAEARLTEVGEVEVDEPAVAPADFFCLPRGWPGPERLFRDFLGAAHAG